MAADVRFLIEFNSNGEPVIRNITEGLDKLAPKAAKGAAETEKFGGAMNKLGSVASVAIGVFGDLGGRVGLLTDALLNMTQNFGPVSSGFALLALTVGFASKEIEKAREQFRLLSEAELRSLDSQLKGATLDQGLRGRVALLRAEDQELEKLRQTFESLRIVEERAGRDTARLNQVEALERNKILDARLTAAGKQQDIIVNEINQRRLETAAIGASGTALNNLALAQQLSAIETRRLAGEHGALLNILAEEAVIANRVKNSFDNFERGRAAGSQFEQIFGVNLNSSRNQTAVQLADAFVPVFNQFGNDPRNAAAFQQAFQSLVEQALATGAPDIQELLVSRGLSSQSLERLKANLGGDLRTALDESRQAGQQWGASLEQETFRVTQSFAQVGAAIDAIARQLAAIQNRALNIPITFSESPARPFSEFIPTMQRHFTDLNSLVESRTPNIDIPVSGLPQQIAGLYGSPGFGAAYTQYQALTRAIETEQNNFYAGFLGTSDGIGRANQAIASRRLAGFQDQLDTLLITAGSDAYGVARSSGGGGGGGSNVTVNIDLRGSALTPAALDETLIPALERGIIRATGTAPDFRVLN